VEDFALKSLTISEQIFGFHVPDPQLDFTDEFHGSVKAVRMHVTFCSFVCGINSLAAH
jgi:hypothetical protein